MNEAVPFSKKKTHERSPLASYVALLRRDSTIQFALLVRLVAILFVPEAVEFCRRRPEVNAASTSMRHLLETVFLLNSRVNVYVSGSLLPPPLLAAFFLFIQRLTRSRLFIQTLFLLVDLVIGGMLHQLAESQSENTKADDADLKTLLVPREIVAVHFFNPLTIMAVLGENLGLLTALSALASLCFAMRGRENWAIGAAAMTGYLDPYMVSIVLSAALLLGREPSGRVALRLASKMLAVCACLLLSSALWLRWWLPVPASASASAPATVISESFSFLHSVYLSRGRIDDLRPNAGLVWYLFTLIFANFSVLVKATLHLVLVVFWVPATIKFRRDPLFLAFILVAVQSLLKPYPTAADYSLLLSLLALQSRLFERTIVTFFMLFGLGGIFLFLVRIWNYWIEYGGFNANFYYSFTLAWNIVLAVIVLEMASAFGRDQVYADNPILADKAFASARLFQK